MFMRVDGGPACVLAAVLMGFGLVSMVCSVYSPTHVGGMGQPSFGSDAFCAVPDVTVNLTWPDPKADLTRRTRDTRGKGYRLDRPWRRLPRRGVACTPLGVCHRDFMSNSTGRTRGRSRW